ncbi:MAG: hypothetical protein HZY73_16680 [Micropruina sp.]|nr:MAG: hypothetical protein HZY73_16680 [Micropruina sp.]
MDSFYFLHLRDVADAPVAYGTDDPVGDGLLAEPGRPDHWPPLDLTVDEGVPTDYLANNLGVRLCSPRLRTILDQGAGPSDELQWLDAHVIDQHGSRPYHVLHFPTVPDVLDRGHTIWVDDELVVIPVIASGKVAHHRIFTIPGGGIRMIVANDVRLAIRAARCTGISFSRVAVI